MRKDGSVFPTEMLSTLFKDESGKPVGLIGLASDISLRKETEEKVKYLAKFPSENPNPVLRMAKDGEILYSNKAGEQLLSKWKTGIGKTAPEKWRNLIAKAYDSRKNQEEEEVNTKTFSPFILLIPRTCTFPGLADMLGPRTVLQIPLSCLYASLNISHAFSSGTPKKCLAPVSRVTNI